MSNQKTTSLPVRRSGVVLMRVLGAVAFALLISLGSWQVQRLYWKEHLIVQIAERTKSQSQTLHEIEVKYRATGDVDYWPVTLSGMFVHEGERHFFATWEGKSGFYVYTPLRLDDGRFALVNRGFVPYDFKDSTKRPVGQVSGPVNILGLARNPLDGKPSSLVPDNDPAKNIFYWKDRDVMAATAGLPTGSAVLPFFIDADKTPNPGDLPVGGVTMVDMPNNHLQYAVTWYGLAVALLGVMGFWLLDRPERK